MFREMRRKKQALSTAECIAVLNRGSSGVLALAGDDNYPYAVPISYVFDGSRIYFHCAKSGHKLDAIRRNGKASFCVIDQDQVVAQEYTTYFKSVIVFGSIRIVEDEQLKRTAIERLADKYAPDEDAAGRNAAIARAWKSLCILELHIAHMTGKAAIELMRKRQSGV